MMILFAMLVAVSAFFTCVGVWPIAVPLFKEREPLIESWAASRLRQRFRAGVQRARLRSIR